MGFQCNKCKEPIHYTDEAIFDNDELKTVDEQNPDWSEVLCTTCFYGEDNDETKTAQK
jgi:predicted nucleic-acid-binding Zn-ribbon protein